MPPRPPRRLHDACARTPTHLLWASGRERSPPPLPLRPGAHAQGARWGGAHTAACADPALGLPEGPPPAARSQVTAARPLPWVLCPEPRWNGVHPAGLSRAHLVPAPSARGPWCGRPPAQCRLRGACVACAALATAGGAAGSICARAPAWVPTRVLARVPALTLALGPGPRGMMRARSARTPQTPPRWPRRLRPPRPSAFSRRRLRPRPGSGQGPSSTGLGWPRACRRRARRPGSRASLPSVASDTCGASPDQASRPGPSSSSRAQSILAVARDLLEDVRVAETGQEGGFQTLRSRGKAARSPALRRARSASGA